MEVTNAITDNGDGGTKRASAASGTAAVTCFDPASVSSLDLDLDNLVFGIGEPLCGWTLMADTATVGTIDISGYAGASPVYDFSAPGAKTVNITLPGVTPTDTVSVTVRTLAERIAAASGTETIILYANENFAAVSTANIPAVKNITFVGADVERTLSLTGNGSMFRVTGSLTLDNNVTLEGHTANTAPLVWVEGSLRMKAGSAIKDNENTSGGGGGVYVNHGSFTMEDGEISGNSATSGGGVFVSNGSFTMEDGKISGNTGDGVSVRNGGSFTMEDGKISGNTGYGVGLNDHSNFTMKDGKISGNTGYGVCIGFGGDSFTMEDGIISDNTGGVIVIGGSFIMEDGEISGNTVVGGVFVLSGSSFTMEDGKISGNTGYGGGVLVEGGSFTMEGGEISGNTSTGNGGGGVYVINSGFSKTGGTIYGDSPTNTTHTPESASNTATSGSDIGQNGHAVLYWNGGTNWFYRNSDLGTGDNITTAGVTTTSYAPFEGYR